MSKAIAYGRIIFEHWCAREMILLGQRIAGEGYSGCGDVSEFVSTAEKKLKQISIGMASNEPEWAKSIIQTAYREMIQCSSGKGIKTGFTAYDDMSAGLHDGDLTILAARPGMGKTAFAMNLATNVAKQGYGVVVFSLEMPKSQLMSRMLCSESEVNVSKARSGMMTREDTDKLSKNMKVVSELPICIEDSASTTLAEIRARFARVQSKFNVRNAATGRLDRRIGLVVIDYLQLMQGSKGTPREQQISEISRGLKTLAKDYMVPVIALSQLNRSVEARGNKDKRPQLSDLRESGSIEQDADNVVFIYRGGYYNKDAKDAVAELIFQKQRSGATGTVRVKFDPQFTRFYNLTETEEETYQDVD